MNRKLIVAITGASGSVYARLLLEKLEKLNDQYSDCAVIFSENGGKVWGYETGSPMPEGKSFRIYGNCDHFSAPASGSAGYTTMIIIPCSMGTLGRIANGVSDSLITRAADVMLKERRNLILVPRETPYNLIHIRNMETLTLAGAVIIPASPSFYSRPATIDELAMTVVDRVLQMAGFEFDTYRWGK